MTTKVSIIIPCHNEEKTIGRLVRRLQRWYRKPEIIVVANGCTDSSLDEIRDTTAHIIEIPDKLGYDVGRAIGLSAASGEVCLVIDADLLVSAGELEPFVQAVKGGVDIALNRYPLPGRRTYKSPTAIATRAINVFMDRVDLHASSLSAVPHALSRKAIAQLGWKAFAVPAVAQVQALMFGLKVAAVSVIPVDARNPVRKRPKNKSEKGLVLGDCLEAVAVLTQQRGARGGYTNNHPQRDMLWQMAREVEELQELPTSPTNHNVAVIMVRLAGQKLQRLIQYVAKSGLNKVTIVCHGTTSSKSKHTSVPTRSPNRYVFLDGDIVISPSVLRHFVRAMDRVDIALNDLDVTWGARPAMSTMTVVKRFLNLALEHDDLGTSSMADVPFAMHREVLDVIGVRSLMIPPLAQVKALLSGFHVAPVHPVNVGKHNRLRRHLQDRRAGKPMESLVLGDHLEALSYLQAHTSIRGPFPDKTRRRDWLERWEEQVDA